MFAPTQWKKWFFSLGLLIAADLCSMPYLPPSPMINLQGNSEKPPIEEATAPPAVSSIAPNNIADLQEEETPLEKHRHFIKGVVLIEAKGNIDLVETSTVSGLRFYNVALPKNADTLKEEIEQCYIGCEMTVDRIREIQKKIVQHYSKYDSVVSVTIPKQDVTDGVVFMVVTPAKIGNVSYKDNRWFSNEQIGRYLDIKTGQNISQNTLLNNASWMNRNPFHYTQVNLFPGEEEGTTNIELVTKDYFPLRVYAGADNTGNDFTGNDRIYAGFNWAFGYSDILTYQFTTNHKPKRFMSQYGNYICFLPWKHILMVTGGYCTTHPDISGFTSEGRYGQASFRYTVPFKPLFFPLAQEATAGVDYKNLNNNLFFIGDTEFPIVSNSVNITQLAFSYSFSNLWKKHQVELLAEGFFSPGNIIALESNHDYGELRPGARNCYFYGRLTLSDIWSFAGRTSMAMLLRLQGSTTPLLPSEEFGLGGYNTVRGYDERAFISDQGLCANVEFRAPPISLFSKTANALVFLAFVDYGWGFILDQLPGQRADQNLLGIGPGVRYNINKYLSARADYGFQLVSVQFAPHRLGKFHLGIMGSY